MLEAIQIRKSYEGRPLLAGISFTVRAGETLGLLGPSGSGKSTLLRILAGLEEAEGGDMRWDGESLAQVPAHKRNFGLMFQDYALFPHLTVAGNVAFGLKMQRLPKAETARRVAEGLGQVGLAEFSGRRVTDLSGGEQQRVALARTLAPRPRLLMFDEPLGALDRSLREQLLGDLRAILRATGVPALYVTHDQEEAFALAGRVILLHEGRIVQQGTPAEVAARPVDAWTARFLGLGNVLAGTVAPDGRVETAAGTWRPACGHAHAPGREVSLLVRPEADLAGDGANCASGRAADVIFQKDHFRVTLENGLVARLARPVNEGELVTVSFQVVECLG
ncbi:MAG: ABC transporter ATP-binding protein [Chloroflexi bacterium]|nr:ABC transporter ATP-binding protein [Chloroflexota bacterium]